MRELNSIEKSYVLGGFSGFIIGGTLLGVIVGLGFGTYVSVYNGSSIKKALLNGAPSAAWGAGYFFMFSLMLSSIYERL